MIDWVIVVWLAASITGGILAAVGVIDAILDLRILGGRSNGRWPIAWAHFREQAGRLIIAIAWTYIGLPLLFDERVVRISQSVVVLVGSNILLALLALLALRTRRELLQKLDWRPEERLRREEEQA